MTPSDQFLGYHSEWNLGSPGGWDYQRITQEIGKAVWERLVTNESLHIHLNFDHPMLFPVNGLVNLLVRAHRTREGSYPGLIAVVGEEETLADVVENQNLALALDRIDGISGELMAPQWLDLKNGRVAYQGHPVSVLFMDFNTDVLLNLHRTHDLTPLLQAVREGRVINPRGTEPINVKSMFEIVTDPEINSRFHKETIARTPWTRRFYPRSTTGPAGERISDLVEWTRRNWDNLVLKPERGYSGKGVCVGGVFEDGDAAVNLALETGAYIVQRKVELSLWAEDIPELDPDQKQIVQSTYQTDFRCLFGQNGMFGFLCRYGSVPTNVGSGGGVQPMAVLESDMSVGEATDLLNDTIMKMDYEHVAEVVELQKDLALKNCFTYLLGPIKMALRPRLITQGQIDRLQDYCSGIWSDCLTLESMWEKGELDQMIDIDPEELDIARSQPWRGSPAIFASDGIFSFGAHKQP
ncbi:MAG: hypothetical protein KGY41_02080 [Desulfovermiculus sp.]|nr:hypothetical protein [Desulfovermiculus sp.]